MDFAPTDEQLEIERAVPSICKCFDDDSWRTKDRDGGFPQDFHTAFAEAGWLGIAMPAGYGGAGHGITEAAILMRTISASGAGMWGASAIHMTSTGRRSGSPPPKWPTRSCCLRAPPTPTPRPRRPRAA
jgi:acyl-CoA dehydrogenase